MGQGQTTHTIARGIKMLVLSHAELADRISSRNPAGCTFIGLSCRTEPKMNKTSRIDGSPNPYYGRLVHNYTVNVMFGANYANSVNRRWAEATNGEIEDYFEAEQLWRGKGERLNKYMARHIDKGTVYLVYQLRTDKDGKALPKVFDEYRTADTGEVVTLAELEPYLPAKAASKKQRVEELGCRETYPRTVHLDGGDLHGLRLGVLAINMDSEAISVV